MPSAEERAAALFRTDDPLFHALIESSLDMYSVAEVREEGLVLRYVSPSVSSMLGYEAHEMVSRDPVAFVGDPSAWPDVVRSLILGPGETSPLVEIEVRHRDGSPRWLEARSTNLIDDPAVGGIVGNFRDITARRLAEQELEAARTLASSVLESAHDAYVRTTGDGRIKQWNRQAEQTFGRSRAEVVGRHLDELILPAEGRGAFRESMAAAIRREPLPAGPPIADFEITALRSDGTEFPAELTAWTTDAPDGVRFNAFIRDITGRKALEQQLSHLALHDVLTGLPNRNLILDSLKGALRRAARSERRVAVLFCDLDQFKVINDSLGHSVGDKLLTAVAERLQESIRLGDVVGRFGGDEFVVISDGVLDPSEASLVGERVLASFLKPFIVDDYELFVTVSVGIALGTAASDPERLLGDADAAMYRAKDKGRARVELFDATMRMRVRQRHEHQQALGTALGGALERGELLLLYQPVVSLGTGDVVGAEALLRWQRPGQGLVGPSEFLTVASDTGLIVPIGAWVLDAACRQHAEWTAAVPGLVLGLSVNESPRRLTWATMVNEVEQVLADSGCRPDFLTLELAEPALEDDLDAMVPHVRRLGATGMHLAIDDFTTGPTSLDMLRRFPVDTLKMQGSLVAREATDAYDDAVVAAIVSTASALGHTVVAKGIETLEQARAAKRRGCGLAQGYFFSRPLSADQFREVLRSGARYCVDAN